MHNGQWRVEVTDDEGVLLFYASDVSDRCTQTARRSTIDFYLPCHPRRRRGMVEHVAHHDANADPQSTS